MSSKIDLKIIDLLSKDSRASFGDIAKRLKVSNGTVRNRVNALVKEGVISKYTIDARAQKLGITEVLLGLDIAPEHYMHVINTLKRIEPVKSLYRTTGDHVAIARVMARSDEIEGVLEDIEKLEGVKHTYPSFIQDIVK